jgi:hypothetical protein
MKYQHIRARLAPGGMPPLFAIPVAALLVFGAPPARAASQLVEVGRFTSAGTIALQLPKFHEQLADGTRISEITVTDHDGYRVVRRKGYTASGHCRTESARLVTANGQAILSTAVAPLATPVFLTPVISVILSGCSDSGCRRLAGVDGLDGHETLRAWCDQTALSDNGCGCHVVTTESVETQLANDSLGLCKSLVDRFIPYQVSEWIRFRYIG